jgi:hypothetical protein
MDQCRVGYCGRMGRRAAASGTILIDGETVPCCDYCHDESAAVQVWEFLTEGKAPGGLILHGWVPLSAAQAFHVMYILQEFLGTLPDRHEFCQFCGTLINTEEEVYGRNETGCVCSACIGPEEENLE